MEVEKRLIVKKPRLRSNPSFQSGVVYVGHLPHGFYEAELKGYFSQFGTVRKVRVARNKKVGQCNNVYH